MENIAPMFSHTLPNQPTKLLLTLHTHQDSEGDTNLQFYENCLVETTYRKKQVMVFDFDLKYCFTGSPTILEFEKQEQRVRYLLRS